MGFKLREELKNTQRDILVDPLLGSVRVENLVLAVGFELFKCGRTG
jgi:hypothetical protein